MTWLYLALALVAGAGAGFVIYKLFAASRVQTAETRAQKLVLDAEREAQTKVQQALVEVKEEIAAMRREAEEDIRTRREEIKRQENRLARREDGLEHKQGELSRRDGELQKRDEGLERIRAQLEQRAREEGDERARKIVTIAIQRLASEQTAESTVSVFPLPSEDMKGRIIGREGRNIRAFEAMTGVNLIIDDTPEAVVLSSFDPVRRETARLTLEKLVSDGRIHPARIEEMHERSIGEVDEQIKRAGEEALVDVGITDVHPEMIKVLGRLQYRTSYGQNVLRHLVEAAHIGGAIAAELGVDVKLVKRCALMHDIGKAVTHEVEGSHALIGAELARRMKERPEVVHAIESHHGEVEQRTIEAVLAQTA